MIDFSVLGTAPSEDLMEHATTLEGFPRDKPTKGILNNRGKFRNRIDSVAPYAEVAVDPQDNTDAELYLTRAFGAPGAMFSVGINTTNSYCLTYWQWGNSLWAQVPADEVIT